MAHARLAAGFDVRCIAAGDVVLGPGYDMPVLAADVALVDIDRAHWANWFDLLVPPALRQDPRWVVLFLDGSRVVEALMHAPGLVQAPDMAVLGASIRPEGRPEGSAGTTGAIEAARVPFTGTSEPALAQLCRVLDVDAVAVLDRAVLDTIYHEIARSLDPGDDVVAQSIMMLRVFKRHHNR